MTEFCHAQKDGECEYSACPQVRDQEPVRSGRHCPLDRDVLERLQESLGDGSVNWAVQEWTDWFEVHRENVLQMVNERGYEQASDMLGCPKGLLATFHARETRPDDEDRPVADPPAGMPTQEPILDQIRRIKADQPRYVGATGRLMVGKWIDAHPDDVVSVTTRLGGAKATQQLGVGLSTLNKHVARILAIRRATAETSQPALQPQEEFFADVADGMRDVRGYGNEALTDALKRAAERFDHYRNTRTGLDDHKDLIEEGIRRFGSTKVAEIVDLPPGTLSSWSYDRRHEAAEAVQEADPVQAGRDRYIQDLFGIIEEENSPIELAKDAMDRLERILGLANGVKGDPEVAIGSSAGVTVP